MALTVNAIRTGYLNGYLGRADGATLPWADTDCNAAISQAIQLSWPEIGIFTNATAPVDGTTQVYTVPGSIKRVSRINVEYSSGGTFVVDKVSSWRYHSPTQVIIDPAIASNSAVLLRFYGWKRYLEDATDLPDELASLIGMKAAAEAYGQMLGDLTNFQQQLGLDSGRVITYQDGVALSAYWQRKYEDELRHTPGQVSYAPRAAQRG